MSMGTVGSIVEDNGVLESRKDYREDDKVGLDQLGIVNRERPSRSNKLRTGTAFWFDPVFHCSRSVGSPLRVPGQDSVTMW